MAAIVRSLRPVAKKKYDNMNINSANMGGLIRAIATFSMRLGVKNGGLPF
jgi:hypothetical protein